MAEFVLDEAQCSTPDFTIDSQLSPLIETSTPTPAQSRWRLTAKNLFLTYPQCDTAKSVLLSNAKTFFGDNLNWIVIAQETHEDGALHLHAAIALKRQFSTRDPFRLDCLAQNESRTFHGNYQSMRNVRNSLNYLMKEDQNPAAFGIDPKIAVAKKNGKAALMAQMMTDGATLQELISEDAGFVMMNHQKIVNFQQILKIQTLRAKKTQSQLNIDLATGGPEALLIVQWLRENIRHPREFKQRQLFLESPPNHGKTSMILELQKYLNIYWAPLEGSNDDLYEDGVYDLVVFDEFHGQRKLTWLNWFMQGGSMPIHRRYNSTIKDDNLPVIILSNSSPRQCYSNVSEDRLTPFNERINHIVLTQFIKITVTEIENDNE